MDRLFPIPSRDPVTGGELIVTELEGPDSGITIRGHFQVPRFCRLSPEQSHFLETFLRCRGMLNSVEKELGISYPTVRARLDAVLRALDLYQDREAETSHPSGSDFSEASDAHTDESTLANEFPTDAWAVVPEIEPISEPAFVEPHHEQAETKTWSRLEILELLEKGEITPEEAKQRLGVVQ